MCQSLHVQPPRRGRAGLFLLVITATAGTSSNAAAQLAFEDVTETSGLSGRDMAAWGDFNNDGFADVMIGQALFRNKGDGTFSRVEHGPPASGPGVWGDADNDGWLDFYCFAGQGALYHNQQDGTFKQAAIPANPHSRSRAAAWGDANCDGRLDLLVTNYEDWEKGRSYPDLYYQANSDGTFGAPRGLPAGGCWRGRGVNWADFDDDGDLDFYVSNYRLMPNQLWVNDGKGRFEDQAEARGLAGTPGGPTIPKSRDSPAYRCHGHTIGSCWGDLNNDGRLDLVVVNFSHPPEWQNRPMILINGGPPRYTFTNVNEKAAAGIHWQESYAKGALGDYDNDGDLDLYVTTVYSGDNGTLFRNDGTGRFTDVGDVTGTRGGNSYQVAWADYDNDGDLDLLAGGRLLRNRGNQKAWIKVKVVGDAGSNRAAIGARVTVTAGDRSFVREIEGGNSGNQNDLVAHFGLGPLAKPVTVRVRFPSGKVGTWQAGLHSTFVAKESQLK
ncbi:MAG: CRTAC1 family protein [Planctomycetota bacterium]|jgi:hypothetical protein